MIEDLAESSEEQDPAEGNEPERPAEGSKGRRKRKRNTQSPRLAKLLRQDGTLRPDPPTVFPNGIDEHGRRAYATTGFDKLKEDICERVTAINRLSDEVINLLAMCG